jgi:hypothetical protein
MHAYSELYAEIHGKPKHELVHDLAMLTLGKVIKGDDSASEIYARYLELRRAFSDAIDD